MSGRRKKQQEESHDHRNSKALRWGEAHFTVKEGRVKTTVYSRIQSAPFFTVSEG